MIINRIKASRDMPICMEENLRNLQLILGQLFLIESFVEDLLNLRLLNEGILDIQVAEFNPIKAIEFVFDMLRFKVDANRV